ncbi:hypothetical protein EZ428_21305 [Pedobacter frigiditerrae]|uniref:Uncharacterized protein n=1 Tax=Pedobacter frigiditerrae TaxID=2530452 RepID=A0A4V2MHP7_9SPHI|nr:hypothetical protein EZ428_21305 [Pedobacter frigiditerrae]
MSQVEFNSIPFQQQALALALWKIKENDYLRETAINELANIGLDNNQVNFILNQVKPYLNESLNETFVVNLGIENNVFESAKYQEEIFKKAESLYEKNILNYELVKFNLLKEGLNIAQADLIVAKLYKKVSAMVKDFQEKLDSGVISEIKIQPNPEHQKGNVGKDQVDRYIAYGAHQMEQGYLDNALELFDKAIELDENATLAYANKGQLFALKNDKEKALYFTNKALELEPNHPQILDNKVDIVYDLLNERKIEEQEFISIIKDILTKDSENPNALIYIIQYFLKQNQLDDALQKVKKLFTNYHNEQVTTQLLLNTLEQLPEEEALRQFGIIESEANEEAKYQLKYNKGLYLKGIRKFEEALKLYDDLNKIQEFSWSYYQMAIMKNLQGKTTESLELLKITFNLEPSLKADAKNYPELQNLWTNPDFIELTT